MPRITLALASICTAVACTTPCLGLYSPEDCTCPPGSLLEPEPCGADTNGGCNVVPPVFTNAAHGDTWCGTAWASGGTRDTDWYLVEHEGGTLAARLVSEFQGLVFIVDGIGSCAPVVVGQIGCSDACAPIQNASADLPAGQYGVFVATGDCGGGGTFDGVPCGAGNDGYYIQLYPCSGFIYPCDQSLFCFDSSGCPHDLLCFNCCCETVALCPWDCADGDGTAGITDFLALLSQWPNPGTCDFDGGGVGITDFLDLLANWGVCPPP